MAVLSTVMAALKGPGGECGVAQGDYMRNESMGRNMIRLTVVTVLVSVCWVKEVEKVCQSVVLHFLLGSPY